jgi:hypothetical protein
MMHGQKNIKLDNLLFIKILKILHATFRTVNHSSFHNPELTASDSEFMSFSS